MACASVSAKRTFTSVEKPKSTAELSTIGGRVARRRCERLDYLGGGSSQRAFLEQPAALAAVHPSDLVRNAFPLAQQVAGHLRVPVRGSERNRLGHLSQGSAALAK